MIIGIRLPFCPVSEWLELNDSPIGDNRRFLKPGNVALKCTGCDEFEVSSLFVLVCFCWKASRHLFNSLSTLSSSNWPSGRCE